MKYTPRLPDSNVNVTPTSPLKDFLVMATGLLAIMVVIYLLLGFAMDLIEPRLSPEFEKKLAFPFMSRIFGAGNEPELSEEAQKLLDRIQIRCAKLPYTFLIQVMRQPTVNALALPGGHIMIFTGLLEKVSSENELAFVLAHEMGHYAHRDHLRGLGRRLVFMALSTFIFGPDNRAGRMLAHGSNVTEMSFSRIQETRADEFALEAVNCVYGHATGTTDFFEKIAESRNPGTFGHYFATHPDNQKRISHLKTLTREKGLLHGEKTALPANLDIGELHK